MSTLSRIRTVGVATIMVAGLALSGCSLLGPVTNQDPAPTSSNDGASPATEEDISTQDMRVGDCLNDATVGDVVNTVPRVSCDGPHDSEVFFVGDLPDGDYPGDDESSAAADALCYQPFIDFVGLPYEESAYDYTWYSPTQQSWESGSRAVRCVAITDSGEQLPAGTLAGIEKG